MSVRPSVRPKARNNSASAERIFIKFGIWIFFENQSRNVKFHSNMAIITGTWREDHRTFIIISRSIFPGMRSVSENVVEKIKTHILCSIIFSENCSVYGVMRKNIVQPVTPQMTKWRKLCTCWETRVTNTHSVYVMRIDFHYNNSSTNAPQCYVTRTLSLLFIFVLR